MEDNINLHCIKVTFISNRKKKSLYQLIWKNDNTFLEIKEVRKLKRVCITSLWKSQSKKKVFYFFIFSYIFFYYILYWGKFH